MTPLQILQNQFGYSSFRLEQERIIDSVLKKQDTFALMPTGGGKSLCYQIPALLFDGLTIVISPLIALMKDQVDALRVNGIAAAFLNSTQSYQEQNSVVSKARSKQIKLLYLAPERIIRLGDENEGGAFSPLMSLLSSVDVSLIAIDEAHCISQWGHDFRPEYLMLAQLKKALPHVPVVALTATADKLTRKDIVEKLALQNAAIFISSFNRPNIRYAVEPKRNSLERLLEFLEKHRDDAGIIYCLSRASTEKLAADLTLHGFSALPYHAGLDKDVRAGNQEKFLKDEVKTIVATIAFGMGINKSNVRYVVHMDLPKNLEGYYQETGRAGRDGLDSEALLFFSYGDVSKLKSFARVEGNEEQSRIALRKLDQMVEYAGLNSCRRRFLLNYFDEKAGDHCGNCDVCQTTVEVYDGTDEAVKALTTIALLDEKFGMGYIIDFLRGSRTAKIHDDHRSLDEFGSGTELSKEGWRSVISDLIERGFLTKTKGMYPLLVLTASGQEVLQKKGTRVMLTKAKIVNEVKFDSESGNYEKQLLMQLKEVRRKLAANENVPAYVVLSDASLMEIATFLPHNNYEFSKISGFGEIKLQKYGKYFWDVVAAYCRENNLGSRMHMKVEKPKREKVERDSDTKRQTLEMFNKGLPVEKIAVLRELTVSTVEVHLAFYIQQGKISLENVLSTEEITMIQKAIDRSGTTMLSSIKQSLPEEYTYGQIRMVIADRQRAKQLSSV